MDKQFSAAILTLSDAGSRGQRTDSSGPRVYERLANWGLDIRDRVLLPDDQDRIEAQLRQWVEMGMSLVITTGGTGFGPRDVTPEATARVIQRPAPGLAEMLRAAGLAHTPMAALSRGLAGIADRTLIINFPGSEKAVVEHLDALEPILPHALDLIAGDTEHGAD